MDWDGDDIWTLALVFGVLSLFSLGGGVLALLPEMQRQVIANGWMDQARFTDFFAIAQAAPGPGMLLVTLIGYHVAAVPGAIVATLAFVLPSGLIAYGGSRVVNKAGDARWIVVGQNAVVPISLGLMIAGLYSLSYASLTSALAVAIYALSAGLGFIKRAHPLIGLAVGAVLGFFWLR